MRELLPWLLMGCSVVVAAFSQVLLKKSAKKTYTSVLREYLNPYVIIGYGMMVASTILTVLAYKFGLDYKSGPVLESLGFVLVMFLSLGFFREKITPRKLIGNVLIVVGIIIFYL